MKCKDTKKNLLLRIKNMQTEKFTFCYKQSCLFDKSNTTDELRSDYAEARKAPNRHFLFYGSASNLNPFSVLHVEVFPFQERMAGIWAVWSLLGRTSYLSRDWL